MSRPIVPRPSSADLELDSSHTKKPRKISTACGACKQRKTKCSGSAPCVACSSRATACIYDVTSDQRRKVANQKNIQDLANTQNHLERHRELLGGILAIFRAGSVDSAEDLVAIIRSGLDLSQLAAHVRNARRANAAIDTSFGGIEFLIDGGDELPSPGQLLNTPMPSQSSSTSTNGLSGPSDLLSLSSRSMHSLDDFTCPNWTTRDHGRRNEAVV